MALEIQHVPTLYGEEAERFVKQADENFKKRGTVDFSKEIEACKRILKKANFNF